MPPKTKTSTVVGKKAPPAKASSKGGAKSTTEDKSSTKTLTQTPFPSSQVVPLALLENTYAKTRDLNAAAAATTNSATCFEWSPRELIFAAFVPNTTVEMKLTFRNKTKDIQFLSMPRPASSFFSLTAPSGSQTSQKVAPGLAVTYKVTFNPTENKDYACDLVAKTENEEYTIPVIAYPQQASLSLPEELVLESCPVKVTTSKSLFLRNECSDTCVWRAVLPDPALHDVLEISPDFGAIEPSGAVQPVEIKCTPLSLHPVHGVIRFLLGPEGDMAQELPLHCNVLELSGKVRLNTHQLRFDDSYVTTESQQTVTLVNNSDDTLHFCWKSLSRNLSADSTSIAQKRANLSASTDGAAVLTPFDDEVFSIEPAQGSVYGRGEKHFTVTFCPQMAMASTVTAYLDVTGIEQPVPLQMTGSGVGPQCQLEFDRLNIGDVYLNALHEYEVELVNIGCIEARYTVLAADSLMGQKFTFSPASGALAPSESVVLKVELKSDLIGVLNETFRIHLHGSLQDLTLQFKGRIVGPSFQFNVDELDFGNVSYNFWHSRSVKMSNTGQVPMNYNLRLSPDSGIPENEFQIQPSKGVIPPMSAENITLDFLANKVGEYDTALLVDIEDVGEAVDSLPVKAACLVPTLNLATNHVNYGSCFIRNEYTMNIEVCNQTALTGKFELALIDRQSVEGLVEVHIGNTEKDTSIEIIEPRTTVQVPVTLTPLSVGDLSFSLGMRSLGAKGNVQTILLTAVGCGPIVEVLPKSIAFGQVAALKDDEKPLTLHNTSPIEARFSVLIAKAHTAAAGDDETGSVSTNTRKERGELVHPIFRVEPQEGVIEPFGETSLRVIACPDEACAFANNLIVSIQYAEGSVMPIPLKVTGVGFALVPDEPLEVVEFGDVFTDTPISKQITLYNKGRKDQELQWQNVRGSKVRDGAAPITFTIKPERALIPAHGSAAFRIEGFTKQVGLFSDSFALKQCGTFKEVLRSTVTANFLDPLLQYSTRQLTFEYVEPCSGEGCTAAAKNATLQSLRMKNVTSKDLQIALKIQNAKSPFSLEGPLERTIASGETVVVGVQFNPAYNGDHVSHHVKHTLLVSFVNHSRTDTLTLSAHLVFPALTMVPEGGKIDFGAIIKDTEAHRTFSLVNPSKELPAAFEWKMLTDEQTTAVGTGGASDTQAAVKRFDLAPFKGIVPPGGTQQMEATFYGTTGKSEMTAVCEVKGGPSYQLLLLGAAGDVSVAYDKTTLDFGVMQYYDQATRTVTITNNSRVAVDFTVDTHAIKSLGRVVVSPMSGTLKDKVDVKVSFTPQVPDISHEHFFIHVGHFDPQRIDVVGCGLMNSFTMSSTDPSVTVKRADDEVYASALSELHEKEVDSPVVPYAKCVNEDITEVPKYADPLSMEAERLSFCRALCTLQNSPSLHQSEKKALIKTVKSPRAQSTSPTKTATTAAATTARPRSPARTPTTPLIPTVPPADFVKEGPPRRAMRRNSTSAKGATKFVLARYIVDFGNMTRNDVRKAKVHVTNTCATPLFLMLDSKELARLPIEVNPLKVPQLAPMADTELEITLDARPPQEPEDTPQQSGKKSAAAKKQEEEHQKVEFGDNVFEFAIDIKGGPVIVVECHCFVATPSLNLSTTKLDFGPVFLGQVKVMPLTLTNDQRVPCEWRLTWTKKEKIDAGGSDQTRNKGTVNNNNNNNNNTMTAVASTSAAKTVKGKNPELDDGRSSVQNSFPFWVNMERGTLAAHESVTVEVFFSPVIDEAFAPTLRFRFLNNSKAHDVLCSGSAKLYQVALNPKARLEYPVVCPYQIAHETIKFTNEEDVPVEVFSYNLDRVHAEELGVLRRALKVNGSKQLFYSQRNAGDLLPDDVLESVYQSLEEETEAFKFEPSVRPPSMSTDERSADAQPASKLKKRGTLNGKNSKAASRRVSSNSNATLSAPAEEKPAPVVPSVVLLFGPPHSGKTTCARHLVQSHACELLDWNQLLDAEMRRDTAFGDVLRSAKELVAATEPPVTSGEKGLRLELPNQPKDPYALPALENLLGPRDKKQDVNSSRGAVLASNPFEPLPVNAALLPPTEQEGTASSRASSPDPSMGETANSDGGSSLENQGPTVSSADAAMLRSILKSLFKAALEKRSKLQQQQLAAAHKGDVPCGFVIDGLQCSLIHDPLTLLQVAKEVCAELHVPLHLVSLAVSETTVGLRYALDEKNLWSARVAEAFVEPLSEEQYERCTNEERDIYNRRLKYYNDCRRELQRAEKLVDKLETTLTKENTEGTAVSVQEAVVKQNEEQAAADDAKGNKRSAKGDRAPSPGMTGSVTTRPNESAEAYSISPLDSFKKFYKEFLAFQRGDGAAAPPSRARGAAAAAAAGAGVTAAGAQVHTVVADQTEVGVLNAVKELLGPAASKAAEGSEAAGDAAAAASTNRPVHFVGDVNTSEDNGESPTAKSRLGQWTFLDEPRLRLLQRSAIPFVRFFSEVEKETGSSAKTGKTGAKGGPAKAPTTTKCIEEVTRWIIPAKSSIIVTVEFCCDHDGTHVCLSEFGIVGTMQVLPLEVFAQAALPDICRDEKKIFPITRPRLTAGKQPSKVYLTAKKLYDFGALLIPQPVGKHRKSNGSPTGNRTSSVSFSGENTREVLTFTNPGCAVTEVTLSFEKEKDTTFSVTPNKFTLGAGASQQVVLQANPETVGEMVNDLVALVKDNPLPWHVQVRCAGTRPSLCFENNLKEIEVDLGRSVVNRANEKTITLYNTSSLPIRWELLGLDKLPAEIRLSDTSGVIDDNGVQPLTMQFCPTNTCLHNVQLQVQVSDANTPDMVFETLPMTLKAEGHDVVLEWTREVNFGLAHVGETLTETVRILNKSPYDVGYQIRVPRKLQGIITVSPPTGIVRGLVGHKEAAIANVDVVAHFTKEGEIPKRLGMLEVAFFNPEKQELLYPLQSVPVTGEAWYTKFALKPISGVDFGSCFFNQKKERTFEIQNTGQFPITYHLFNFKDGYVTPAASPGSPHKEDASAAAKKSKIVKNGESDLQLGCFTASPGSGVVPVGESQTVTVQALLPDDTCRNREVIGIYVDQSGPEEENRGVSLEVSAHPATPGIACDLTNNADVETIFEEQQVVYRLDQFDRSTRAYGKEDRTFSFGTVLVGQAEEERFRFANSSPLPSAVTLQLIGGSAGQPLAKGGKQPSVDGFEMVMEDMEGTPYQVKFVLPPYEGRFVTVRFTPSTLQNYSARVVAHVENGTDAKTNSLTFQLRGEGTLPNVEYVLPPPFFVDYGLPSALGSAQGGEGGKGGKGGRLRDKKNSSVSSSTTSLIVAAVAGTASGTSSSANVVELPLTLVGTTTTQTFTVRNVGTLAAHVCLSVVSEGEDNDGLVVERRDEDVSIMPDSQEDFRITYTPTKVGKSTMKIRATLRHNPFEDKELMIEAQSFSQSVSFEHIEPAYADLLNVGFCYPDTEKTYTFEMRNNSAHNIRYAWHTDVSDNNAADVVFVPDAGHLAPGAAKSVTLHLTSHEASPARHLAHATVHVQSIELMTEASWDSTMVDQKWVVVSDGSDRQSYGSTGRRNLKKVMEPVAEPAHRVLDDLALTQPLHAAYICDYPSYDLALVNVKDDGKLLPKFDSIVFATTKMFQRRVVTLRVKNTGTVALPYEMMIEAAAAGARAVEPTTARTLAVEGAADTADNNNNNHDNNNNNGAGFLPVGSDYEIEPDAAGCVDVGEEKDFSIVFSPHASGPAAPMSLLCNFPNCREQPQRRFPLVGTGECPLVHVQVPPSPYLNLRVDGEAGPSVNPDSTVLEFVTRGLHTQASVRFQVYNPTASAYTFDWTEKSSAASLSPFQCLTPTGTIPAGRSVEMAFDFTGETLGIREREWSLAIVGKDTTIPFLLVGKTVDPHVFFNGSKIQFGSVNLGGKVEKIIWLENRDDAPSSFTFNKAELKVMSSFLTVKPASGTVGPKEKLPITISFAPQDEMVYNIPLSCQVKKASTPLSLNVKGTGACVHDSLVMEPSKGHPNPLPVEKDQTLLINLGRVQVDERVTRTFILSNTGQSAFDYSVVVPERRFVSIEGASGSVPAMGRSVVTLIYNPMTEDTLRQFRMQFKIGGKVSYQVGVQASTYVPKLQLSFERYDFGPRFVGAFNMNGGEISTTLSIVNVDKEEVTVECSMTEGTEWCTLSQTSFVAKPNGTYEVKLTFHPDEVRVYSDQLRLLLNGAYPIFVAISGEGVQPRVEIVNRFAKFGAVRVGEKKDVELRLKCNSRIPTPISFMGCLNDDLVKRGVSIAAAQQNLILKPREVRNITLSFKPTRRMGEFQREVKMLVCGREHPFAMISGACQDAETHLDTTMLLFNDVVIGSSVTRRVVIMNSGDIAQKFTWRNLPNTGELTVVPPSGFMQAHTDFACDFVYRPSSSTSSVNQKITLDLESAPPLSIQVEAGGMQRPPPKDTVRFNCRARQVDTQKIVLENTSPQIWTFTPVLDNNLWSAPSSITIKPKAKGEVELQYAPMRETKTKKDTGSLFIPQENGRGVTYLLEGTADAAGPSAPLREIALTTNTAQSVNFTVSNWSSTLTNFTRTLEWTSPANLDTGLLVVKGAASIDVGPQSSGEIAVSFLCVKEGQYRGVVHFNCNSNPDLNQYYELHLKVSAVTASVSSTTTTMEVRGVARAPTVANIPIGNPLSKPIQVNCKLEGPPESLGCIVAPPSITVPAKNAANLGIEFTPLVHRPYAPVKVLLTCPDLDSSTYTLNLQSSPAPAERLTHVSCPLGQQTNFSLHFTHMTRTATEFAIKFAGEAGAAAATPAAAKNAPVPLLTRAANQPATVKANAVTNGKGQELSADFTFEPRALGVTKEVVEFVSPAGGTFSFPILATCVPPQPLGPFQLHSGQSAQLPFRNVFAESIVAQLTTDSPFFTVGKKTENVASKKVINIAVQCKMPDGKDEEAPEVVFGKLIVTCLMPGTKTPVEWIYYLEGLRDTKKK